MSRPLSDSDESLTYPEQVQFEREHKEDRDELVARLKRSNDRAEIVELCGLIYGPATAIAAGRIYDAEVVMRGKAA